MGRKDENRLGKVAAAWQQTHNDPCSISADRGLVSQFSRPFSPQRFRDAALNAGIRMPRFRDTKPLSGGDLMQAGIANEARAPGPAKVRDDQDGAAMSEGSNEDLDAYIQALTASQGRLRGFILASLGNYADTADVLQRTNLVLWKKAKEFRPGAEFLPWALTIARYEVLSFIRDSQRDRHVYSADVANLMLDAAANEVNEPHDRRLALRKCLEKIPSHSRDLLWQRYGADKSIRQIATDSHRSEDAVKSLLLRIRKSLERCVEADLKWKTE